MNALEIKKIRKELGLTQADFAEKIGVSRDTIINYEKGAPIPSSKIKMLNNLLLTKPHKENALTESSSDLIPLIPIEAMAGFGTGEGSILELDCEKFMIPTFKGADYLIQIKGSSMYPKYNSGDIVACKNLPLNDIFFQWNKVYVLDTIQGALIKRIDIGPDDEHIMIVSDNEKYRPFPLHKSEINAIAIVMGVIRLE
ncbi:LexA family transcriptional regulator [Flavobacterium branchiophilum]|uniref:HTH cro/C1-type domain-containing protein n=1 Tax=Flavobacterium branchiophilum TaxID=55197 RepID=A0A2H3K8C4_9FLAO|nr:LexA family transcriptional regulator [Flavobacterium branchiophilum]PDS21861.1 hypothetical protein B0A77_14875 [Flavobacterium branchiophilum]